MLKCITVAQENNMKKIIFILLLLTTIFNFSCYNAFTEKRYCGKVTEMYRTDAGYKSSPECHIVFYSDSLHRKIDVKVTFNSYANVQVGEVVCFSLQDYQVE
jgi:hypothetical protein